jgi:hypothetical protein
MSLSKRISIWVLGIVVFILWSLAMMSAWSATPVIVVSGSVKDGDGKPQDGWTVTIENTTRKWTESAKTGSDGPGAFSAVRLDFATNAAAEVGDVVKVTAVSPDTKTTLEASKTLTNDDILNATVTVELTIPKKTVAPEDLNGDGTIDISDIVTVARDFGKAEAGLDSDVNKDGVVNIVDLVLIARRFGERLSAAAPSPTFAGTVNVETNAVASLRSDDLLVSASVADGTASVAGYSLDVAYDPSRMALVGVEEGAYLRRVGETFWEGSLQKQGNARILGALLGERVAAGSGELARLRFRLLTDRATALATLRLTGGTFATADGRQFGTRAVPTTLQLRLSPEARTLVAANYPNPFNPETWIPYQLAEESNVSVRIYDASGALVRVLNLGVQDAGGHVTRDRAAYWDGRNEFGETVASGVYYYEFRAGEYVKTQRMLILK